MSPQKKSNFFHKTFDTHSPHVYTTHMTQKPTTPIRHILPISTHSPLSPRDPQTHEAHKTRIHIHLTDEDIARLERLRGGYSKSTIISMGLKELEKNYPLVEVKTTQISIPQAVDDDVAWMPEEPPI